MYRYSYFAPYYRDELYHYGVPGMKWGVRKKINQGLTTVRRAGRRMSNAVRSTTAYKKTSNVYNNKIKPSSAYQKTASVANAGKQKLNDRYRKADGKIDGKRVCKDVALAALGTAAVTSAVVVTRKRLGEEYAKREALKYSRYMAQREYYIQKGWMTR